MLHLPELGCLPHWPLHLHRPNPSANQCARARARWCVCLSIVSVVRDRVQIRRPESCIVLWHAKSTANALRAARCLGMRGVRPSYAYENAPLSVGAIHIQPFHPVCCDRTTEKAQTAQTKRRTVRGHTHVNNLIYSRSRNLCVSRGDNPYPSPVPVRRQPVPARAGSTIPCDTFLYSFCSCAR